MLSAPGPCAYADSTTRRRGQNAEGGVKASRIPEGSAPRKLFSSSLVNPDHNTSWFSVASLNLSSVLPSHAKLVSKISVSHENLSY